MVGEPPRAIHVVARKFSYTEQKSYSAFAYGKKSRGIDINIGNIFPCILLFLNIIDIIKEK